MFGLLHQEMCLLLSNKQTASDQTLPAEEGGGGDGGEDGEEGTEGDGGSKKKKKKKKKKGGEKLADPFFLHPLSNPTGKFL